MDCGSAPWEQADGANDSDETIGLDGTVMPLSSLPLSKPEEYMEPRHGFLPFGCLSDDDLHGGSFSWNQDPSLRPGILFSGPHDGSSSSQSMSAGGFLHPGNTADIRGLEDVLPFQMSGRERYHHQDLSQLQEPDHMVFPMENQSVHAQGTGSTFVNAASPVPPVFDAADLNLPRAQFIVADPPFSVPQELNVGSSNMSELSYTPAVASRSMPQLYYSGLVNMEAFDFIYPTYASSASANQSLRAPHLIDPSRQDPDSLRSSLLSDLFPHSSLIQPRSFHQNTNIVPSRARRHHASLKRSQSDHGNSLNYDDYSGVEGNRSAVKKSRTKSNSERYLRVLPQGSLPTLSPQGSPTSSIGTDRSLQPPKRTRKLTTEGRSHAAQMRRVKSCDHCRRSKTKCTHKLKEDMKEMNSINTPDISGNVQSTLQESVVISFSSDSNSVNEQEASSTSSSPTRQQVQQPLATMTAEDQLSAGPDLDLILEDPSMASFFEQFSPFETQ